MPRLTSASPEWERLKAERGERPVCTICEEPLRGKQRVLCGADDCWRAFDAIQRADARRRAAPLWESGT